jgi:hypothetical protein
MRRYMSMLFILIVLLACRLPLLTPTPTGIMPFTPSATATALPATITPTVSPSPWTTSTPTATLTPEPPAPEFAVEYHPDGPLYVGDQVSLSVIAPPEVNLDGATLTAQIEQPQAPTLGPTGFSQWGIAGRIQATIIWGWDTTGLAAGDYTLSFAIDPQGTTFTETVTLLPASAIPPVQVGAQWAVAASECCVVHYITGTAAERDLPALLAMVDQQAEHAVQVMGIEFTEPITITVMPRVLGHGGFASDEVYVSYLDRNYAANSWEMVVHHEMIHILDGRLGGDLRPSILVEGLAVYMSGGHYKPEALLPRAAALLGEPLKAFIPLSELAEDFYNTQHEIGYLEAGALVQYLVETYGWEMFSSFYRDIHPAESGSQAEALEVALQAHFGQSLAALEQAFIAYLRLQVDTDGWQEDVRLTVAYFDTLRRYQELLDPSAYFKTAWLMDGPAMRQRGIVGDLLRHPSQPNNLALEALFISASDAMVNRDMATTEMVLAVINQVLDEMEAGNAEPFNVHPLAADILAIASTLQQYGYWLQSVELNGDTASVLVTADTMELIELNLSRQPGGWQIN